MLSSVNTEPTSRRLSEQAINTIISKLKYHLKHLDDCRKYVNAMVETKGIKLETNEARKSEISSALYNSTKRSHKRHHKYLLETKAPLDTGIANIKKAMEILSRLEV